MIINVTDSRNLNRLNSVLPKKDFFLWFYADWCGHCKSMEPEWEKLVKTCGNKYNLARVRDDQKDQLINNLGQNVQGFPTLGSTANRVNNSVNNGYNSGYNDANNSNDSNDANNANFNVYSGPRTADDFMKYIKQHLVQEQVKRSMKKNRGINRCTGKANCKCSRCKARRFLKSMIAKRAKQSKRAKRELIFVKPKKGCGSKRLRSIRL